MNIQKIKELALSLNWNIPFQSETEMDITKGKIIICIESNGFFTAVEHTPYGNVITRSNTEDELEKIIMENS